MPKVERWQLEQRRGQSLEIKILMSKERIKQWYSHWDGEVYVAFSGGLDSTALLYMVRSMYPDVPAVFHNTGLEYPEIVKFVKATDNVYFSRPKKKFHQILADYGYPVISKKVSRYVHDLRHATPGTMTNLRLTGMTSKGRFCRSYMLSYKWRFLIDAPFEISDRCCYWLKKSPAYRAEKKYGAPMLGILASESDQRAAAYSKRGCNSFDSKHRSSWPLAFWTREDVWGYIRQFNIPYCCLYDQGCTSTGCFACMFGVHMEKEPNRFQRMKFTHPKLWAYCMDKLDMRKVLEYINVPYE